MDTAPLKSFATWARIELLREVDARLTAVLAPGSKQRIEYPAPAAALEADITAAGGGKAGRAAVVDRVAYTWFNRIIALRYIDASGYTSAGVVSPTYGQQHGQPEILADAKRGSFDTDAVPPRTRIEVTALLDGTRRSDDRDGEAYTLLLADYCRYWNAAMPFMFSKEGDYTELLIPANLLADGSMLSRAVETLTPDVCEDVEVIGWLYQFYISERKDEVFAGFKKNKKAGAAEIPAATQLFTPHWIVRYLVENSLGRLWMLNNPDSNLREQMDYYIAPVDEETDFLKIGSPEELTVMDPACGSGHMLTYAFDLLYAIYEEEGYAPSDIPGLILTNNLYGTEIDQRAGSLAAFALTMKARARQRTFFAKGIEPNVCALEPIRFDLNELDVLVGDETANAYRDFDRAEIDEFWNIFEHADIFGSLIQPRSDLIEPLRGSLTAVREQQTLLASQIITKAHRVIKQARYLAGGYGIVVANPPYMGSRSSSAALNEFAAAWYPNTKMDLYSMFIERGLGLATQQGFVAMVTMESWMFIRTFERLRRELLASVSLLTMAHLGPRAFDSIAGEVVGTTAFIIKQSRPRAGLISRLIRVVEQRSEAAKSEVLRTVANGAHADVYFDVDPTVFLRIKGAPLAYWLPAQILRSLIESRHIDDLVAFPTSAHKTGDNSRYVRCWWEVSAATVGVQSRWVPYAKGGGARRWFGLLDEVVDWAPQALNFYASNSSSSLMNRDPQAPEGITYSMLTSGPNTFRVLPAGSAFDMGGPGFFPTKLSVEQALAVVNSDMTRMVLDALNPTLNLQVREVKQIPVPEFDSQTAERLQRLGSDAIVLAKRDWNARENAMGFTTSSLVALGGPRLSHTVSYVLEDNLSATDQLIQTEREIGDIIWNSARVDPSQWRVGGERATLAANSLLARAPEKSEGQYATLGPSEAVSNLISYAVGCMFGRYSLDQPGLVLADQSVTLRDYLSKVPAPTFMPDSNNVIPIVDGDWFEDDVVGYFRKFLRVAFGEEHFEENLQFVAETLGVKNLRDYFVKSFYTDHVRRYKNRPIYWLFSSPKGSFNMLVYLHRYTPSTVPTILTDYLRDYIDKLQMAQGRQDQLAADPAASAREKAAAAKEADRLRKVLIELEEYEHDILYPLAQRQLEIDLDDGVLVNYLRVGKALKPIPAIEKKRSQVETWTWPVHPLQPSDAG